MPSTLEIRPAQERSVDDPFFEKGFFRECFIQVNRVEVADDFGKFQHIVRGNEISRI